MRVAPPYIVGSDGVRTDGALAVSDCAVDSNPSAPWGRPVTAPGASKCTVRVTWPDAPVVYPAILDPRWTTTGSMGTARFEHTLSLLSTGKALAAGGRSTTSGTTGLTTAELYDPTSGTWSPTGSMAHGRRLHSMTQLGSSSNSTTSGKVLVAGGISGTTSTNSAELYSPSAGTWVAAGNLDTPRHAHTATLLADGRVLAAGGLNGTTMLTTAALYNPASSAGSWVATTGPVPPTGIKNHTATLIQTTNTQLNNHVLLVGGNNGSSTVSAVYLFDPVQNAFSTLASIPSSREQHTAVTLASSNGKILVAGGKNGSTVLASAIVFDPGFSNGSWSSAGTMNSPRVGHTMTLLPSSIVANGQLLVAGGSSTGSDTLSSAELFSGTSTWTTTPAMPGPLQGQQAVLLGGNMVLVAGGLSSTTTVQSAAYLYDASFGLGCTSNGQCASGFCVSGICCDTTCTGTCGACNLAGHLGTCTALSSGTVCRAQAGACDVAETCNGSALTCPADGFASSATVCRSATGECDAAETCTGTSAACPADTKKASGTACTDDGNVCTKDQCDGSSVTCQHPAGNAGTVCRAAAPGGCDVAETCTGASATCPADAKAPDGTTCNDGSACTTGDACHSGTCTGTTVTCTASDQCHVAGTCNPSTGCSNPTQPDGTACNDGSACTTADACHTGTCSGTTVTCAASDQCHVAGTCNPSTGACSNPNKANGTTCNDNNACTTADACQGGTCTGTAITCTASDQCHVAGTCSPSTGACSNPQAANGTACSDGNSCTTGDACQGGTCASGDQTCVTLTLFRNPNSHSSVPNITQVATPSPSTVVPGDLITFTSAVTNASLHFVDDGFTEITNTGTTPFTIGSYQQSLEYFSVTTATWVPFAKVSFDATGAEVDDPNLPVIHAPGLFGVVIPAGGAPVVPNYTISITLQPDILNLVSDATQTNGVRDVLHIDTGAGSPGVSADVDVSDVFTLAAVSVDNVVESVQLHGQGTQSDLVPLTVSTTTIAPGVTLVATGAVVATPFLPRDPTETDGDYRNRINSPAYVAFVNFSADREGSGFIPVSVNTQIPLLAVQKSGPAQGNAGLTLPYPVQLQNIGLSAASESASSTPSTARTSARRSPCRRRSPRGRRGARRSMRRRRSIRRPDLTPTRLP